MTTASSGTASSIHDRSSPPANTASSGASIRRSQASALVTSNTASDGDDQSAPAARLGSEERGEQERDHERGQETRAGERAGTGHLSLDPDPERARNGVDTRLVRELAERENRRQDEGEHDSGRGRDEWAWEPVREPDDEDDQPEREEVERVAVVQAVVAPRRAREGRDDEEAGRVRGEEERRERGVDLGACAPSSHELCQDDRRDRERDHGEVDLDVGEVVHDPLRDAERVVAAPQLPVGAERVARRGAADEPCSEERDGREQVGARSATVVSSQRARAVSQRG